MGRVIIGMDPHQRSPGNGGSRCAPTPDKRPVRPVARHPLADPNPVRWLSREPPWVQFALGMTVGLMSSLVTVKALLGTQRIFRSRNLTRSVKATWWIAVMKPAVSLNGL